MCAFLQNGTSLVSKPRAIALEAARHYLSQPVNERLHSNVPTPRDGVIMTGFYSLWNVVTFYNLEFPKHF